MGNQTIKAICVGRVGCGPAWAVSEPSKPQLEPLSSAPRTVLASWMTQSEDQIIVNAHLQTMSMALAHCFLMVSTWYVHFIPI